MILNMEIKPGDRIPEAKIATQLGISRTPIRDAMLQLANDGIINIYPNILHAKTVKIQSSNNFYVGNLLDTGFYL